MRDGDLLMRVCDVGAAQGWCGQFVAVLIRALMCNMHVGAHVFACVFLCAQVYVYNYRGHGPHSWEIRPYHGCWDLWGKEQQESWLWSAEEHGSGFASNDDDLLLNSEKLAHFKSLRKVKHMNMRDIRVAVLYGNVWYMKIRIIWVDCARFAALVGRWRQKADQIYVLCHASHFYLVFLYLQCQNAITLNQSFIFTGPMSTVNLSHSHRLVWSVSDEGSSLTSDFMLKQTERLTWIIGNQWQRLIPGEIRCWVG